MPKKIKKDIVNYYELMPSSLLKKSHNPNYKHHLMELPFRALSVGSSGAMKTNTLLDMIHRMSNTFTKIIVCLKNKDEPLYNHLEESIGEENIDFYEIDANHLCPDIADLDIDGEDQVLMVYDDLVLEKNQASISQNFIRGRKLNISMIYLTQSYFATPKVIRNQCNYLFLKKLSCNRDLSTILSEYNLGVDKKDLTNYYKFATRNQKDTFIIDTDHDDLRFRKNYLDIIEMDKDAKKRANKKFSIKTKSKKEESDSE